MILPQSINPERIAENAGVFDFVLSAEQMSRLSAISETDAARKFCWDSSSVQ